MKEKLCIIEINLNDIKTLLNICTGVLPLRRIQLNIIITISLLIIATCKQIIIYTSFIWSNGDYSEMSIYTCV